MGLAAGLVQAPLPRMQARVWSKNNRSGRDKAGHDRHRGEQTLSLAADTLPLLLPLQEFAEQRLALILRRLHIGDALLLQEGRELRGSASLCRIDTIGLANSLQHLFRHAPPGPTRHRRGQIDVTPLREANGVDWKSTRLHSSHT